MTQYRVSNGDNPEDMFAYKIGERVAYWRQGHTIYGTVTRRRATPGRFHTYTVRLDTGQSVNVASYSIEHFEEPGDALS